MHQLAIALHLLAVTAWVGGLFVVLAVVRPAMAQEAAADRHAFWSRVLPRLFTVAWLSAAVSLATGFGLLFSLYGGFAVAGMHIHWMAGLGLLMTALLAWSYFGPLRRFELAEEHARIPEAASALALVFALQWPTLAAGAVAMVVGGVGAYWG